MRPLNLIWILLLLVTPAMAGIQADDSFVMGEKIIATTQHNGSYTVIVSDINNATILEKVCQDNCLVEFTPQLWVDEYTIEAAGETKTIKRGESDRRLIETRSSDVERFELIDSRGYVYDIEAVKRGTRYIAEIPPDLTLESINVIHTDGTKHDINNPAKLKILNSKGKTVAATMRKDKDKLEVTPHETSIKKLVFNNIKDIDTSQLKMEDVPSSIRKGTKKAYAIDPTGVNFTKANVTSIAQGTELYKCKEYIFDTQTCYGSWTKVMELTPGEEYSFTLTPQDPVFAETDPESVPDSCTFSDDGTGDNDVDVDCRSMVNASGGSFADMDDIEEEGEGNQAIMDLSFLNDLLVESINSVQINFRYMRETNSDVGDTTAEVQVLDGGSYVSACTDTITIGSYETFTCDLSSYITTEAELNDVSIRLITDTGKAQQPKQTGTTRVDHVFLSADYIERDVTPPRWSDADAGGSQVYKKGQLHQFNATWTDDFAISTVVLENNFTGTIQNNTVQNNADEYYYTTELAAGTYSWQYHAEDTSANKNSTPTYTYTIEKAKPELTLSFNSTEDNMTINNSATINITGTTTAEGIIEIIKDETTIAKGKETVTATEVFDTVGTYNITLRHNTTQNFTDAKKTYYITVQDTLPPPQISSLHNTSNSDSWIHWSWSNPADPDFDHAEIWINGTYKADTTGESYNATGLNAQTKYQIEIRTVDQYGNKGSFVTDTTTTLQSTDTTPPVIIDVKNSSISSTSYNISWHTDEIADSLVRYGTTSGNYQQTESDNSNVKDHAIILSDLTPSQAYYYVINSSDIAGNSNETEEYSFTTDPDTKAPEYGDMIISPSSPKTYTKDPIWFNITWTDNYRLDTAWIEHNFSGTLQTDPMQNISDIYYYATNLGAGSYYYRFLSNDSSSNLNFTTAEIYEVEKAQSTINLSINGSDTDTSIDEDTRVNITTGMITPDKGNIELHEDSSLLESGSTRITHEKTYTDPGTYNITALYGGSQNYTGTQETLFITVNDTTKPTISLISPETGHNDSDGYVIFTYDVDDYSINNCSLIIDTNVDQSHEATNGENSFSKSMEDGTYDWAVECYDDAGNYNITNTRNLIIDKQTITIDVTATDTGDWDDGDAILISDINETDGITETRTIGRDIQRYITWTNFTTDIPPGATIVSAVWNVYHSGSTDITFDGIDWYTGTSYVSTGCSSVQQTGAYRTDSCDISDFVETVDEANNVSVQYHLTSTKNNQQIDIDHMYLSINYIKETTEPVVKLTDPGTTKIYTKNNTISLNYTVQEDYPDYCNIWSDFSGSWAINYTDYTPQENNSHTVTLPHGKYKWTVECVDLSNNTGNTNNNTFHVTDIIGNTSAMNTSSNIVPNITIDNKPLNITKDYEGILNVTIHNSTEPMVSFTHDFSDMLDLRSIDLAAGNGSIAASVPDKTITLHVPVKDSQCNTIVCEGVMDAQECTSSNQKIIYQEPESGYCNVIVNGTWAQDQPDETDAKATDLYPENYDIKEGDNITIYGEVSNEGNTIFPNLTIHILDGTDLIGEETIYNLSPDESVTINTTWIADLGSHNIRLLVDPEEEFQEFNETNNNMSINLDTSTWQTYYGDISGNMTLGDGTSTAHVWIPEDTGNVYLADSDHDIDWSNLQSLGRNTDSEPASQDFLEADTALNLTGHPENITGLFSTDGSQPKEITTMTIKGKKIQDIPVINSTNSSDFRTGILWDTSSSNEYDGSQHLVFVTELNKQTPGRFGIYDYEIRVPAQLEDADPSTQELAVYVEII
ncbi:MAG: CARDB domain-containing protein [Candidatus Woesearchaeota archaeon]